MANWPWFTIITAVVAVYGAVLSTLNYCSQRRRDQQATVLAWDEVRGNTRRWISTARKCLKANS